MKTAEQFLKEKGIKDTLYNVAANDGSWIKCGLSILLEEYRNQSSGTLADGVHPDEINPRAETWLKERGNWEAEVNKLREHISEQDLIIRGIIEGSESWKSDYENCRAILKELVDLKIIKESLYKGNPDGKEYAERKPKAWEAAKEFLATTSYPLDAITTPATKVNNQ